jgi:hypothetical protein
MLPLVFPNWDMGSPGVKNQYHREDLGMDSSQPMDQDIGSLKNWIREKAQP